MSADTSRNDVQTLWQEQSCEGVQMSLQDLRLNAQRLERSVTRRNRVEYVAAAVGVVLMAIGILDPPMRANPYLARAGKALLAVSALVVVYRLHRAGSAQPAPAHMGMSTSLEFYRSALARQRDLLASVWSWYLFPLVPGFSLFYLAFVFPPDRANTVSPIALAAATAITVALLVAIGWLNARGARFLQRQIDDLDALNKPRAASSTLTSR